MRRITLAFTRERERERGISAFHNYDNIISVENLLISWREFLEGKRKRKDVILFSMNLIDNIYSLHNDLKIKTYKHSNYEAFKIDDPKPRNIHKASVRDRLLHHAVYRILYPYFDKKFIFDSYSCRVDKGTHKAINRFRFFFRKVSKNNTKTCWVLKCDIKKFFANIDHKILKEILSKSLFDTDILWLLGEIIDSFHTNSIGKVSVNPIYAMAEMKKHPYSNSAIAEYEYRGLPLGNLTSQLLVNIYMNEFDQFVKHKLKVKYYIRYADDFVVLQNDKIELEKVLEQMKNFLETKLKLNLHPNKVFIKTIVSSVDFLGWVHFPKHRVLRTATKKRMFRNINKNSKPNTVQSYLGMLSHGNTYKLSKIIEENIQSSI
ncbi:MAG: reverse transcriptase/maturase family protein [Candidatus Nomurabacteria bacterium]|nr:reverse transcriptase/maturase family protein [Candidatus Nomurabacteria bacterium]